MARNRKKNKKKQKKQQPINLKTEVIKKGQTLSIKERNFRVVIHNPGVIRAPRYI